MINEENKEENKVDVKSGKKKIEYVVKITNIDKSMKIKDLNRYFNKCGSSKQNFPAIKGKSQGYGEIHFSKKETAKLLIDKFNRMNLCGSKINMKLTKKVVNAD